MISLYQRFTTSVLELVDPYTSTNLPPSAKVWPYVKSHLYPMRVVLVLSVVVTILAAAIEVWLISYAGTLIDTLTETNGEDLFAAHGVQLVFAAVMLLLFRPLSQLWRNAINDIGLNCNAATLTRWRAHDHLAKQSVGWFQEDLTGRTAVRLVDIGNHVSDLLFQMLNAIAFGLVYMIGIIALISDTDSRLAFPLFAWLVLYIVLLVWYIPRIVTAQQAFQGRNLR